MPDDRQNRNYPRRSSSPRSGNNARTRSGSGRIDTINISHSHSSRKSAHTTADLEQIISKSRGSAASKAPNKRRIPEQEIQRRRAAARRRRQKIRRRRRLMLLGAVAIVILCVILCVTIKNCGGAGENKDIEKEDVNKSETEEETEEETEPKETVTAKEPGAGDGTSDAGIMVLTDERTGSAEGWNKNDEGLWYSPAEGMCYYSGWQTIGENKYHFDANGYAATGWTAISYQDGRYFTEDGVYVPEADSSNLICLTFDDGPTRKTQSILDILEEYDAKATFFVLGVQIESYGEMIPKIIEAGHQIGNHTYSHTYFSAETDIDTVASDFAKVDEMLAEYGVTANFVRFPGGEYTSEQVAATGRPNVYWDNDTRDWEVGTADEAYQNALSLFNAGNIILMHDMYDVTVEMLPRLLNLINERGYECVTLSEMIAAKGYTEDAGITFFGFKESNLENGTVYG